MTDEQMTLIQVGLIVVAGLICFGLFYLVVGRLLGKVKTDRWQIIMCVILGLVAQGIIGGWWYQIYHSKKAARELEAFRVEVEAFEAAVDRLKEREAEYWRLRHSNESALGTDYSKKLDAELNSEEKTEESQP